MTVSLVLFQLLRKEQWLFSATLFLPPPKKSARAQPNPQACWRFVGGGGFQFFFFFQHYFGHSWESVFLQWPAHLFETHYYSYSLLQSRVRNTQPHQHLTAKHSCNYVGKKSPTGKEKGWKTTGGSQLIRKWINRNHGQQKESFLEIKPSDSHVFNCMLNLKFFWIKQVDLACYCLFGSWINRYTPDSSSAVSYGAWVNAILFALAGAVSSTVV